MEEFSLKQFIKVLFPVTTTQYWYFTAYAGVIWLIVLYILGAFMRKQEFVETVSTGKFIFVLGYLLHRLQKKRIKIE